MKLFIIALLTVLSLSASAEKITVLADTHFGGPHNGSYVQALVDFKASPNYKVPLGDISDIKWTLKKEIKPALKAQAEFSDWCIKNNVVEIEGNHDLNKATLFYVYKNILFTHGHYISWEQDVIDKKAKASKDGVSKLKRAIFGKAVNAKPYGHLSQREILNAVAWAKKYNAKAVVFGHVHVEKIYDEVVDGIRVISVPRGLTTIEI